MGRIKRLYETENLEVKSGVIIEKKPRAESVVKVYDTKLSTYTSAFMIISADSAVDKSYRSWLRSGDIA